MAKFSKDELELDRCTAFASFRDTYCQVKQPKIFLAAYTDGRSAYGAEIEAQCLADALVFAAQRKLGERIIGKIEKPTTHGIRNLILAWKLKEAVHEASFMCQFGLSSGVLSAREVVGDEGIIHLIAHLMLNNPSQAMIDHTADLAFAMEMRVPGWPLLTVYRPKEK